MLHGHGRYLVAATGDKALAAPNATRRYGAIANQSAVSLQGASVGTAFGKNYTVGILEKIFGRRATSETIREVCRDAYYYDSVMGGCADLMCDLPFSDFSLAGLSDREQLETYLTSLEQMRIKSLLPVIALDYLVDGAFLGVLSFSERDRIFTSMVPQDLNQAELTHSPIFGHTPMVDVKIPREHQLFINSKDPRAEQLTKDLPQWFVREVKKGGQLQLNPEVTVYIPRRTLSSNPEGVSYFSRCLPIFLIEKALLHGTLEQAYRRQRAILHITAGDEDWEPNDDELTNISNLFQKADQDPIGAIVSTRQGINPTELLSGGQFWRYDESYSQFTEIKMRALGISDALLSGDATWATLDQSLSVFIQSLKAFRDVIVRRLFYEKIFPYIAHQNGYRRDERTIEVTSRRRPLNPILERELADGRKELYASFGQEPITTFAQYNPEDYFIPAIDWHNKLRPEADEAYLALLGTLREAGIPIPMRLMAAAAGQQMEEILGGLDQDVKDAEQIAQYREQMAQFQPQEEEEGGGAFASGQMPLKRVGMAKRNFEIPSKLSRKGQAVAEEQIHKHAAPILARVARKENARERAHAAASREARRSEIYGRLD